MSKAESLAALERRKQHKPKQIDNASLHAGSPMYFYCRECGWPSDTLPESFIGTPKKLCAECQKLEERGWLP
jgi:RNA polymerase-binding transcription factor DksA